MTQDRIASSGGDTLEFLRLMNSESADRSVGADGAHGAAASNLEAMPANPSAFEGRPQRPRGPVVIKGGPRRVARADGRQPSLGTATPQRRFELSSGAELFKERKRLSPLAGFVVAAVSLVAVTAAFACATQYGLSQIAEAESRQQIGTTSYDGALSLTPAKDGGYYTVFFVTEQSAGGDSPVSLQRVVMYRLDEGMTTGVRIEVPTNLYVAKRNAYKNNYYTLKATFDETQNVTRSLQAICDAFDLRLYNVVVCDGSEYDLLSSYMAGDSSDTSLFETSALSGVVRTNLSESGLQAFCDSVRTIGSSALKEMSVPCSEISAGDVVMLQASPTSFNDQLAVALDNRKYDERGYYYGTSYDAAGNPILDANGNPYGAIYLNENTLYFDENGYLVFYGQHYDDRGYPVGTMYDEAGNPLLDAYGNPLGTVYDEWGNPTYDWLGNIVIQNG